LLTNLYNYSTNRRGVSPGVTMGFRQELGRIASLQLDYTYDRGSVSALSSPLLSNATTHFLTGSMSLNLGSRLSGNAYFTRGLNDGSLYGALGLDYYPSQKWRLGVFSDYSDFADYASFLNYGWSIGRQIGQREVSLNWSRDRNRIFIELGGMPY
jgi:hypothetical protein